MISLRIHDSKFDAPLGHGSMVPPGHGRFGTRRPGFQVSPASERLRARPGCGQAVRLTGHGHHGTDAVSGAQAAASDDSLTVIPIAGTPLGRSLIQVIGETCDVLDRRPARWPWPRRRCHRTVPPGGRDSAAARSPGQVRTESTAAPWCLTVHP
eukprot:768484-Hanusia_phi.AAC.5